MLLYESRDRQYWVIKEEDGSYTSRRGHVIFKGQYESDEEAVKATKKDYEAYKRKLKKLWK